MLTTNGIADGEIEYNTYQDIGLDIIRYATEEEVKLGDEDNKESCCCVMLGVIMAFK